MKELLRNIIREALLLEEVYGAQAVVYHGSQADPKKLISALLNDEFRPGEGEGSMYGKGLYTVYEPKDTRTMGGGYGDYIIKLKINLYGYIIFDPDTAQKVYGSPLSPADQAKKLGYSSITIKALAGLSSDTLADRYTSNAAYEVYESLQSEVKGIAFTGKRDGRVAVVYDPTTAIPMSWKKIHDKKWTKVNKKLLLKPQERQDVLDQKGNPVKQSAIRRSALGSWEANKYDILKKLYRLPPESRVYQGHLDFLNLKTTTSKLPDGLYVMGSLYLSEKFKALPNNLKVDGNLSLFKAKKISVIPDSLKVGGDLNISGLPVASLPPNLMVGGSLFANNTKITSIHSTVQVFGSIYLDESDIESIPENLDIYDSLSLRNCKSLKSLPQNLHVPMILDLSGSSLTELPDNLTVGRQLILPSGVTRLPKNLVVKGTIFLNDKIREFPSDMQAVRIAGFTGDYDSAPERIKNKLIYY